MHGLCYTSKRIAITFVVAILAAGVGSTHASAQSQEDDGPNSAADAANAPEEQDLDAIGQKLGNPLSNLWFVQFSNNFPSFFDGNINRGDPKAGATTVFQPVMPIPLWGEGDSQVRMITRPIVPIVWAQPVPDGPDKFEYNSGIGDIQLPLVFSKPDKIASSWILGAGPVFEFPAATDSQLGADQWSAGPAIAIGHKSENLTWVLFGNYFWKIGSAGQDNDVRDTSKGSLLYSVTYGLNDGWQIGTNPTILYNHQASSGDKWTVPVGAFLGRTVNLGGVPVNLRVGLEYSIVRPDDFGTQAALRFLITPVIPGLIQKPLFGE